MMNLKLLFISGVTIRCPNDPMGCKIRSKRYHMYPDILSLHPYYSCMGLCVGLCNAYNNKHDSESLSFINTYTYTIQYNTIQFLYSVNFYRNNHQRFTNDRCMLYLVFS